MKKTKYRFLSENVPQDDELSDDDSYDGADEELDSLDSFADVEDDELGRMSASELKRKFQNGEINYDSLLKYLMGSDQDADGSDDFDELDGELDDFEDDMDQSNQRRSSVDQDEQYVRESAPPGEEDWVRKMKPQFVKRYGKQKGMDVLYATAWKRHSAIKEALGDDEDDLSPAERALIAKSDRDLKRKSNVDAKFDQDKVKKQPAKKPDMKVKAAKADTDKSDSKPSKKPSEDKQPRGRGKPIGERGGNIRSWFKQNPNVSRKDFMAKAADMGMGAKHANTLYYSLKRQVGECFFVGINGKYLTESSPIGAPHMIGLHDEGELMVFESKQAAYRMAKLLGSRGQQVFVL